jgi:methionine-rich copper-binding protein CopC
MKEDASMSKKSAFVVLGVMCAAVFASPVMAHPKLAASLPAANATVSNSPSELRLIFNEDLEVAMSGIEVMDEAGRKIEIGKARADTDKKQLVIPLSIPLKAGTYNVFWHAVAADTHRVKGTYSFTVKP